jgi:hypothetical protein
MPEYISLMPEPGTPQYDNMRRWMRQAYSDPRNVRFRREVNADLNNLAFLTQGGTDPLPDVTDPVRSAVQINVTLLTEGPLDDEDQYMEDVERALRSVKIENRKVIDVLITDVPERVTVLDAKHYQAGDHFQNAIDQP